MSARNVAMTNSPVSCPDNGSKINREISVKRSRANCFKPLNFMDRRLVQDTWRQTPPSMISAVWYIGMFLSDVKIKTIYHNSIVRFFRKNVNHKRIKLFENRRQLTVGTKKATHITKITKIARICYDNAMEEIGGVKQHEKNYSKKYSKNFKECGSQFCWQKYSVYNL